LLIVILAIGTFATKDACINDQDAAIINDKEKATAAFKDCAAKCLSKSSIDTCVDKCLVNELGISATCASCFGAEAKCTLSKCLLPCVDPSSAKCEKCSLDKCGPALQSCTGIPINSVGASNQCTNDADAAIISNQDQTKAAFKDCGSKCLSSSSVDSCVDKCLVNELGLSSGCASCFGADAKCTLNKCLLPCVNPTSAKCEKCSLDKCGPALQSCTGIPIQAFSPLDGLKASGKCTDSSDYPIVNDQDTTKAQFQACASACISKNPISSCVDSCMTKKLGLSSTCASCFGDEAQCTIDSCLVPCLNPNSAACEQCSLTNCGPALEQCTGIPIN
jgi:hypothetical protein